MVTRSQTLRAWHVALPLVVGTAVRLAYGSAYWHTVPSARAPVVDPEIYVHLAARLRAGDWFAEELLYHSVLYPIFLALFPLDGEPLYRAVIYVQQLLGIVSTALLMFAASRIWRSPWHVVVVGIAYTLTIPLLFYETKLYPATLAVTLVSALVWAMATRKPAWVGGIAGGLLLLTRSEGLLIVPVVVGWAWWSAPRHHARHATMALVPMLLGLGLAAARASAIAGVPMLTPTAGGGPLFYACSRPEGGGEFAAVEGLEVAAGQSHRARHLAETAAGHPLDPVAVERYWWGRGTAELLESPGRLLALGGGRLLGFAGIRERSRDLRFYSERADVPLLRVSAIPFPVIAVLGLLGLARALRRPERSLALWIAATALPALAAYFVVCGTSRYRVPLLPAVLLFAPEGVRLLWGMTRASVAGRVVGAATAALLVGMLLAVQLQDDRPSERALYDFNEGTALLRLNDLHGARARLARAVDAAPTNLGFRTNQAAALIGLGELAAAETTLRAGLAYDPANAPALAQLGYLLSRRGRIDEAAELLQTALRHEPDNLDAKFHLAVLLRGDPRNRDALGRAVRMFTELAAATDLRYARVALLNLGFTQALLGDPTQVDDPFARAAALQPLTSAEEHDYAVSLALVGRTDDARLRLLRAVELDPANVPALRRLAAIERERGNSNAARDYERRAGSAQ